jgi:hypothetical protein
LGVLFVIAGAFTLLAGITTLEAALAQASGPILTELEALFIIPLGIEISVADGALNLFVQIIGPKVGHVRLVYRVQRLPVGAPLIALFQVFPLSGKRLFVTVVGENNHTN